MGPVLRIRSTERNHGAREFTLPDPGGIVGRDPDCTVVLEDPSKHVSRKHLKIYLQDGQYYVSVVSKVNPVDLNGSTLRFGESARLNANDHIMIPPYEIEVATIPDAIGLSPTAAATQRAGPAPQSGAEPTPFPWLDSVSGPGTGADNDIFNLGPLANPAPSRLSSPDPFQRVTSSGKTGPLGDIAAIPPEGDVLGLPDSRNLDPLKILDSPAADGTPASDPFGIRSVPLVDLGGHERRGTPSLDHVHDMDLPFANSAHAVPPSAMPKAAPAARAETRAAAHAGADPLDQLLQDLARQAPASPRPGTPSAPFDFDVPMPRGVSAQSDPALDDLLSAPAAPAQDQVVASTSEAQGIASMAAPSPAGLDRFLAGLGIPREALHIESDEKTLELAGQIVRVAIESIIAFLLSRSVVKKELRAVDRTMLASRDNNPLKVMDSPEEALRFLFDGTEERLRAFQAPVPALKDACDDILAHELALLAGCRAAVIAAFNRFDPRIIEKQNEKGGLLGAINRRAQLWDSYAAQFEKTQAEMADQVEKVLSRDFMKEYMIQVAKFKRGQGSKP